MMGMPRSEDRIAAVRAYEILDSRGQPTLAVRVVLEDGHEGLARVPAGASTGAHEAVELRDGGSRYGGKGVQRAVDHVERVLGPGVVGLSAADQTALDRSLVAMDGDPQKARLGANALLGVSLAVARARAEQLGVPLYRHLGGQWARTLPVPLLNVLNGGVHADNNLDIQEFMLVPWGASRFSEAMRMAAEVYMALKARLKGRHLRTAVGDEGGFAPDLADDREALDLLVEAIGDAGLTPGEEVALAVDVAASELYADGRYRVGGRTYTADELVGWYEELVNHYPLVMLEDGLAEDDWEGWRGLTARLGARIQLVGDDVFVTNPTRVRRGIAERSANAVLIKLNQIGTVTETLETMQLAQRAGWGTIVSHRSGETEDTSIADLAVATNAGQIKTGAPARGERVAKYNRLLMMEADDPQLTYAGREAFRR
jgi:enolase